VVCQASTNPFRVRTCAVSHSLGAWARLARWTAVVVAVLALAACGDAASTGVAAGDPVWPLAKAEGWRDDLDPASVSFEVVEIAYDRQTAERAWRENVPEGLRRESGAPDRPELYGSLDEVDFDAQVVVVWSSGQSGSCPGWLADLRTDSAGTLHLERDRAGGRYRDCTDDYNPYRMVLAVDRERVPAPEDLPTEDVSGVPEAVVVAYPARF
jgi:hypothetical protein